MRRLFAWLLALAFLLVLAYFLLPLYQRAQRFTALLESPPPRHLPNPLPGQNFVDTFGAPRSGHRKHEGIDIFAKRGTPIHATTDGFIAAIGSNGLGGRTVTVLGPGGQRHYYAHLERYPALKFGDWVRTGDVVGYVGDSGNARGTPTHLHYGIYTRQGAINPYPLLK